MPIKKRKLGSYPYLSVVFSITMALFVIGLLGLLILFGRRLSSIIKEKIEVHVYLNQHTDSLSRNRILRDFYYNDFIAEKNGKKQIFFVSKEEAAKKFIAATGEDFIKFLGENPLRDAYVIRIDDKASSGKNLKAIKAQLEEINGVFEVVYVEGLIEAINQNIQKISLILLSFACILLFTVFLLINSTIKLALFSQRFLIRSMQLVGARPLFIQLPFLSRAAIQGVFSGILASGLLLLLLYYANLQIPELPVLEETNEIMQVLVGLLGLGALIGLTSSYLSVNKYLKLSLDELY